MKLLQSVKLILTMAIQPSGAAVQQQLFERVLTFSDGFYNYLWEVLLLLSYLARLAFSLYSLAVEIFNVVLLAWAENLSLIALFLAKVVLYHVSVPSPYG